MSPCRSSPSCSCDSSSREARPAPHPVRLPPAAAASWRCSPRRGAARADIFVSPFLGREVQGQHQRARLRRRRHRRQAVDRRRHRLVSPIKGPGLEVELGYNPRFFERGTGDLVTRSGVTTLFGNFMLALPLSITRESLRPYAVGGLGWVHASANDTLGPAPRQQRLPRPDHRRRRRGLPQRRDRREVRPALHEERSSGDVSELTARARGSASGARPSGGLQVERGSGPGARDGLVHADRADVRWRFLGCSCSGCQVAVAGNGWSATSACTIPGPQTRAPEPA